MKNPWTSRSVFALLVSLVAVPASTSVDAVQPAGTTIELQVTGTAGVPNGATAAAINLTATNPKQPDTSPPTTAAPDPPPPPSTTPPAPPSRTPASSPLSSSGKICIHTLATTDIVADITGWFPAGSDFSPRTPARLLDTRTTGTPTAGRTIELQVTGTAGVPNGATAAAINLTATNPQAAGHLTAYNCGTRPTASTLNYAAGTTIANASIIPLSSSGKICIHTLATTDIVADITGWFPAGSDFSPRTPARLLDTRTTGTPTAGRTIELQVTGTAGVPNGATAAAINLTATNPKQPDTSPPTTAAPDPPPPPSTTPPAPPSRTPASSRSHPAARSASTPSPPPTSSPTSPAGSPPAATSHPAPPHASSTPAPPPAAAATAAAAVRTSPRSRSAQRSRPVPNAQRGCVPQPSPGPPTPGRTVFAARERTPTTVPIGADSTGSTATSPGRPTRSSSGRHAEWGIDEDIARAQVVKESYWYQSANGDNGESWGLGQVRDTAHQSAFQYEVNAQTSSAYNLDYTYAS
ncbi:MAG: hypothetical protein R2697_08900 [Ilumatobacteraceae bacterium]